jgi:hypothetical protein
MQLTSQRIQPTLTRHDTATSIAAQSQHSQYYHAHLPVVSVPKYDIVTRYGHQIAEVLENGEHACDSSGWHSTTG